MPHMSGIEMVQKMRQHLKKEKNIQRSEQPKIIGVTGHVQDHFKQQGIDSGMDEIYSKPLYAQVM